MFEFCLCEREPNQLKKKTMRPTRIWCAPRKWTIRCENDLSFWGPFFFRYFMYKTPDASWLFNEMFFIFIIITSLFLKYLVLPRFLIFYSDNSALHNTSYLLRAAYFWLSSLLVSDFLKVLTLQWTDPPDSYFICQNLFRPTWGSNPRPWD